MCFLVCRKGSRLIFLHQDKEIAALLRTAKRGNANKLTDIVWSPSQSSLFWFRSRVPGNGSAGDRDFGFP